MNWIYSKESLEEAVKKSSSYSDVLVTIGRKPVGSNFKTLKKYLSKYNIDVSHFDKGQSKRTKACTTPTDDILNNKLYLSSDNIKKRLVSEGIKEYKCECCGISEWNGKPITLQLHHINGDHYDNRLENLMILCPNCHSQTDNYAGKNGHNKDIHYTNTRRALAHLEDKVCLNCGKMFSPAKSINKFCCRKCYDEYKKKMHEFKSDTITLEVMEECVNTYNNITEIAEHLNTSRPTVRKILIQYDLLDKLKSKYDFHAKEIIQYDMNGNFIKKWPSINDAEMTLSICKISDCALYKRKSAGGFIWRYSD